jgi:hypothetical protein
MPWSEPCEPVASNVVDFSKTYEAMYLTKVLAELEKINPKPWECGARCVVLATGVVPLEECCQVLHTALC